MSEENNNPDEGDNSSEGDENNNPPAENNDGDKGQGDEGSGDSPKGYVPEGIAEHYVGANDQETIDKLYSAVQGYRKEQSKKNIPEKAEEYTFDLPDELKEKIPMPDEKDPLFPKFQELAVKHKLSKELFNDFAVELYGAVAEASAAGESGDENEEKLDFAFESYGGEEKAKPVQDGVIAWAEGQKANGVFDDNDVEEVRALSGYSQGLKFLAKLREQTGEKPIPVKMDGNTSTGKTEAELRKMMDDPRYWKPGERDDTYIAQVQQGFAELYKEAS